ncbi:MAG: helix-turn-helix domain-containing protein [Phycisphaeraceae bacterium]|nr:helix-turn-helix domain-containing protein [Phycisphaeraceae bacterium]
MKFSREEIREAIDADRFPPILTPDQAAALLQVSKSTIYRWVSEDRCCKRSVRRGNPLRFWRDGLVEWFFSGRSRRKRLRPTGSSGTFSAPSTREDD